MSDRETFMALVAAQARERAKKRAWSLPRRLMTGSRSATSNGAPPDWLERALRSR
jgi:hypothetical protein